LLSISTDIKPNSHPIVIAAQAGIQSSSESFLDSGS